MSGPGRRRTLSSIYTAGAWGKPGFGVPKGRRQTVSEDSVEAQYATVKVLANQLEGGDAGALNEGIRIVRRISDGKLSVEKKIIGDNPQLRREIHMLHHLKHPNVVEFVDGFITDTKPRKCCLYLGFCDFGSIDDLIKSYAARQTRIPEAFVWHIFEGLAAALQYIHHGVSDGSPISENSDPSADFQVADELAKTWPMITHRDIKGGNVLLLAESETVNVKQPRPFLFIRPSRTVSEKRYLWPRVVLADFGVAMSTLDKDFYDHRSQAGTPNWLPPELRITFRGDIWAAGALVWALCYLDPGGPCRPPPEYPRIPPNTWYMMPQARHGIEHAEIEPAYSQELGGIMRLCLRQSPEQRPWAFRLLFEIKREVKKLKRLGRLRRPSLPPWLIQEHENRNKRLLSGPN